MISKNHGAHETEVVAPTPAKHNTATTTENIPHTGLIDTGLGCHGHQLQYQPESGKVFCPVCKRHGVKLEALPEHQQQLILQAVLYV